MREGKFEQALEALQNMSEKIKAQDTTLEDAIACYEEGMKHYKVCSDILENAKQRIETFEGEV
ncbi:exodeoxyribonuclease VII small subunit [Ihubacter sp. rT4E-8]|uniref:exodeoxyribonuclease VII small subunit n=1 Tax=unclassified Ihubacter TaxID=2633299 RepID=UPI0013794CA6